MSARSTTYILDNCGGVVNTKIKGERESAACEFVRLLEKVKDRKIVIYRMHMLSFSLLVLWSTHALCITTEPFPWASHLEEAKPRINLLNEHLCRLFRSGLTIARVSLEFLLLVRLGLLDLVHALLTHQHGFQVPTRRFITQIGDRLACRHGTDLDDGEAGAERRVTLVGFRALGFAREDVPAEVGFGREWTSEADHLGCARGDGFGHGVCGLGVAECQICKG
jgi:hypothetical protein